MGITQQGIDGEQMLFSWLAERNIHFFQADAIGIEDGKYVVYEVKNKSEPFKPPPFYGHGLNIKQVQARLIFYQVTGIRCKFVVFQKGAVLWNWLDELNEGKFFDTKNQVRIYPVENFNIEEIADR